ncbi:MAG: fibronectin type III domain-containing protein [Parcubacteria group bacterium]|nr:fibronectin type III domain-containing protein [Parcubacteria group bacterium]
MSIPRARFSIKNIPPVFIGIVAALAAAFILAGLSLSPSAVKAPAAVSVADTVPPRITAVAFSEVGTSSAKISWETDEPSDSLVEYGLSISFGFESALTKNVTNFHSVAITDLTPGTPYYYRVRSKDAAGNRAVSEEYRVRTLDRPSDPNDSVLTVMRVSSSQDDDTKYTVSISDPDGLGDIYVKTADGVVIRNNHPRYGFYGGIRACPTEPITTDTITLDPSSFPLSGYVIDCAHVGVKYPVTAEMPSLAPASQ